MTEDLSPAERYAAARMRAAEQATALAPFREMYDFGLDPFQIEACQALEAGKGVLVAAPTGSGKTIVGEFAVHLALQQGTKCFYTTPIKALSNQKYADLRQPLRRRQGRPAHRRQQRQLRRPGGRDDHRGAAEHAVRGLADAARPRLRGHGRGALPLRPLPRRRLGRGDHPSPRVGDPGVAVGDRVQRRGVRRLAGHRPRRHRGDRLRAPARAAVAARARRAPDVRPVRGGRPRRQRRPPRGQPRPRAAGPHGEQPAVVPGPQTRPRHDVREADRERERRQRAGSGRRAGPRSSSGSTPRACCPRSPSSSAAPAARPPSSSACTRACGSTTTRRARRCARIVEERTAVHPRPRTSTSSGYYEWLEGLERGIAAHHAGMLPTFKEVVEELFVRGLVKAVFATETLALGINMPARSVVLEKLVKWNGEQHADITPGEYTQLTGRAGRRGIDVEGHAVVLWQRGHGPGARWRGSPAPAPIRCAPASSRRTTWRSTSSQQFGRHRSRELLETSFAQFQADKSVVGISRQVQRNEEGLEGYRGLHDLPPRRLRGVRAAAPRAQGPRDRAGQAGRGPAAGRGRRRRWRSSSRATSSTCRPASSPGLALVLDPGLPAGRSNGHRGLRAPRRPAAAGADRRAAGQAAGVDGLPGAGRAAGADADPEVLQRRARRSPAGTWRPRCAPRPGTSSPERHRKQRAAGGRRPRDRPAAHGDPGASLPRLRRPRGPRPLGRALPPAAAGHLAAGAAHRGAYEHHRPHLRPDRARC